MRKTKRLLFIFFLANLAGGTFAIGQRPRIDSLLTLLKKDKFNALKSRVISGKDTTTIKHLNALCYEYQLAGQLDSALYYGNAALDLATKVANAEKTVNAAQQSLMIKQTAQKGMSVAFNEIGTIYGDQGNLSKALEYYFKALKTDEEIGNKKGIALSCNHIANVYQEQGNSPLALEYYLRALKTDEEIGNKKGVAIRLSNIGNIYTSLGDYSRALDYYFQALKINEEIDRKNSIAINLGNIGNVYNKQANYPKALEYYSEALKKFEKLRNSTCIAINLGNIGTVYKDQAESGTDGKNKDSVRIGYNKALDYYFRALKIDKKLENKNSIATRLVNIGSLWTSLGKYNDAYTYLYGALALSDSIGAKSITLESYEQLSKLYEKAAILLPDTIGGKTLNKEEMRMRALHYYQSYVSLRDTIYSEESKKQLLRKEMNFDFEKKEAAIKAEQDKKDALAKEELGQKEQQRNYFIIGFALVVLLAVFIFRSYRQKQKANEIITEQKLLVEEKQKEILDSIYYARRIQQSLLPKEIYIERSLKRLNKKASDRS